MNKRTAPHGYVYPFMSFTTGRTDMGKDFTGKGPILAIGKARILATHPPPGWPEGGGILYKLLDGPRRGQIVYVYEGVDVPGYIKPGMVVNAGEPIATFRPGGSIETGFADARGETLAHDRGESAPGNSNLRAGKEMARFLEQIEKHTVPAQLGHIKGAPSFLESFGEEAAKSPGEVGKEDLGIAGQAAGSVAEAVANGLGSLFASHAEALMLNIGLVGGGAFLVYYGTALMMGVKSPGGKLTAPLKGAMIP